MGKNLDKSNQFLYIVIPANMEFTMKRSGFIILFSMSIAMSAVIPLSAALSVDVNFDTSTAEGLALQSEVAPLIETELINELSKYSYVPDLARGFGNASTYSSHASTLRGYQGYSVFGISIGSMISVQAPNGDPLFFEDLADELEDGDVYAGAGVSPMVIQAGLNLDFILDGLYLSFTFGKYDLNYNKGDQKIDLNENIIGFNVAYQLLSDKSILANLLVWRGLSVQSGLLHYRNISTFYYELDTITNTATVTGPPAATVTYELDPSVDFEIETKGNVIPVEIYSAVRIFYILNIGVGGGFDYVVGGKTDITLKSAGDAAITDDGLGGASGYVGQTAKITVDADTSGIDSDAFRAKILANIGLSMGPVFIDVPVSYYLDNGYAVGITAGCVW